MNEYEPNNIILCFAPLFSIEMIKEKIKKEKKDIENSIKYYTPCELGTVNLERLKLMEIKFYSLTKRFVLIIVKFNKNEFYYDFIDFEDFDKCLNKLKESNERVKKHFIHYTRNLVKNYYQFVMKII